MMRSLTSSKSLAITEKMLYMLFVLQQTILNLPAPFCLQILIRQLSLHQAETVWGEGEILQVASFLQGKSQLFLRVISILSTNTSSDLLEPIDLVFKIRIKRNSKKSRTFKTDKTQRAMSPRVKKRRSSSSSRAKRWGSTHPNSGQAFLTQSQAKNQEEPPYLRCTKLICGSWMASIHLTMKLKKSSDFFCMSLL